jgi:hypothetical protein
LWYGEAVICCFLVTKKDEHGNPLRAKILIVVLGNKDPRQWTKCDVFAPVATQTAVRLLVYLAIEHNNFSQQGDCKNVFCNPVLLDDEVGIVCPLQDVHFKNQICTGDSAKLCMDYIDHPNTGMKCSDLSCKYAASNHVPTHDACFTAIPYQATPNYA